VKSLTTIEPGTELCASYGPDYWSDPSRFDSLPLHTQLQVKRAYPEIPRPTGTTILRDAFGIVLAPPPLRPGVVGANSFTSFQNKTPQEDKHAKQPSYFQALERPKHTNNARRPVVSIVPKDPSPPQKQQSQTVRPGQAQMPNGTLPVSKLTDPPPSMPLPNGASSIDPGETSEVPEVSPLQCT